MVFKGPLLSGCGRFDIDYGLIEQRPEVVRRILSRVLVVRAEAVLHKQAIDYVAYGEVFDPVTPGMEPPCYDVEVDEELGTIRWIRVDV